MSKYTDIKTEYDALFASVRNALPDTSEEDFRDCYLAGALRIWGGNELYAPAYGELLETITGETYTVEQIVTALGCCGEPERKLQTPGYFCGLVEKDAQDGGRRSARFVEDYSRLMIATALVNGDFTAEEDRALAEITDGLLHYAEHRNVPIGAAPDYGKLITKRLDESYYHSAASLPQEREQQEVAKPAPTAPDEMKAKEPDPIRINVTIRPDGDEQPPTEAPAVREPAEESLESLLAELDSLVGLAGVKRDVHNLMNFIKIAKLREARGMKIPTVSYHLVFTGNPGTGKTTVARLVARLYYQMGLLSKGQFVETDRAALVAGYLGQTAIKTQKVIQQAMGGVLFIDEAYSLAGETEDSYGREAIETLLKAMEDHRDELVIIVAGYTELMHKFIQSNPGLSSRFNKYFEFPDYTGAELLDIFRSFCEKNGYRLSDDATAALRAEFERLFETRGRHFGNARTVRNLFEKTINAQADRVVQQIEIADSDLELICLADVTAALGSEQM